MKLHILAWMLLPVSLLCQNIEGNVRNSAGVPLIGASVYWSDDSGGVTTDYEGIFTIPARSEAATLVFSYLGYTPDSLNITAITTQPLQVVLSESTLIENVVVKGRRDGIIVSNINPIKTEQLNQTELKKAACCDLAGCFGTQASVQPHTTNVITNAKELRILGLSGVYNQVLINGLPMIQGLSYTYGISSFPGTVVDNIFISKGANSVLQGYESISGQINVLTKAGNTGEKLLLNIYMNSFLEKHMNLNFSYKKGYWSSHTAVHSVLPASRIDSDEDTFLDLPLLRRNSISNTWKYRDAGEWGWSSEFGARYLREKRLGGQLGFREEDHRGGTEFYGQTVQLSQPEVWTKTGFRFDDTHNINFSISAFHQQQQSTFGTLTYDAQQVSTNVKVQYELNYDNHSFKTGLSLRFMDLREDIQLSSGILGRTYDGRYTRVETVPGVFAENTMRFLDDRLTWIAGIRNDYHNQFGNFFTPRTLVKYDFSAQTVVRANVGTGWRTTNLFSENVNLLVSSRDIIIEDGLQPEQALNYGVNLIHKFDLGGISGYFSSDFYRTEFQNQIFPDYDSDPTQAIVRNFFGKSIANGFQGEVNVSFMDAFQLKAGYNFLDVYRLNGEEKEVLPFNSTHRFMTVLSFSPLDRPLSLDVNAHWHGRQRLPNTMANPDEFRRDDYSKPYSLINIQGTYKFPNLELYAGCENVFDFRQERPIISWQDPFSPYFDTNSVWGPTRGRELYLGIRYYMRRDN